ncbi:hypothetical protein MM783_000572 [Enterococcus faecalis]|nr:hypothetical protein [Enterococcus faecalis]
MFRVTFDSPELDYFFTGLSVYYPIIPRIGDMIEIPCKEGKFLVRNVTIFPITESEQSVTSEQSLAAELSVQRLG